MLIESIKNYLKRDWQRFREETKEVTDAFRPTSGIESAKKKRALGAPITGLLFSIVLITLAVFFFSTRPKTYIKSGLYRVETYQGGRLIGSHIKSGESLNESASKSNAGISWILFITGGFLVCKYGLGFLQALSDLDYFQRLAAEYSFNIVGVGSTAVLSVIPGIGLLVAGGVLLYGIGCLWSGAVRKRGVIYAIEGIVMLGIAIALNHSILFGES
jgi:hypothetical protein